MYSRSFHLDVMRHINTLYMDFIVPRDGGLVIPRHPPDSKESNQYTIRVHADGKVERIIQEKS